MTMFDSSNYDIATLIEKLRDQRFDGYDSNLLADEVEKFRGGAGTASMGNAVEALKSVVGALANTDGALRTQLSALGVTWQSQAGGQASAVLSEQAGFANQAYDNVTQAAQLIFAQSEAFTRTKNKLPDPETLRQGDSGYSFADTVFSLFGFETDHASAVKANTEARAQAVDALNSYAHDSGDYLASSQTVPEPQTLNTAPPADGGGTPTPGSLAAAPTMPAMPTVPTVPDTAPTTAAGAKDVFPAVPQSAPVHGASAPPPPPPPETPTPVVGIAVPGGGSAGTMPQSTAPSSFAPPQTGPSTGPGVSGGPAGGGQDTEQIVARRDATGGGISGPTPGPVTDGSGGGGLPGSNAGSAWGRPVPGSSAGGAGGSGAFGGGSAGSFPRAGGGGGSVGGTGGTGGGEPSMGAGKLSGANTPAPSSIPNLGPGGGTARGPAGVGAGADSATAIGAGAVGGAVSGEDEQRGRGIGRSTAAERGKPVRPLDIGELPEEEEAQRANRATPQTPSAERTRAILEPAATQDGDEDAEHVRRYGVDDKDLFTDSRSVSPDLIGDRPLPEER